MWKSSQYNTTKLTLELRDVLETGVNIWGDDGSIPWYEPDLTGLEEPYYSICDMASPQFLKKRIEDHFYFRQIGCETLGRWLHMFRTHVAQIMPYYAQLYKSQELMFRLDDPFGNVDIVETFEEETKGNTSGTQTGTASSSGSSSSESSSTAESSGSSTGKTTGSSSASSTSTLSNDKTSTENKEHRFSNTPQESISNIDSYLTEAAKDKNTITEGVDGTESTSSQSSDTADTENESESTTTGSTTSSSETSGSSNTNNTTTGTTSGTVKHTLTRKGNQGVNTYAHDMKELRETFINIEQMIIADLNHLFLGIY